VAQVVNTNVPSLNAQYSLDKTQTGLDTTLHRLATGLRVNRAADDAAGLAIGDRFTTQIRGTDQGMRNANDGISMVQTAEGALSTMASSLQRIRELAVQAANATNSATDRQALDQEVQQLIADLRYTAFNAEFNSQTLLDGSRGDAFFQAGPNQGQMIAIDRLDARSIRLGYQEAFPDLSLLPDTVRFTNTQVQTFAEDTTAVIGRITINGSPTAGDLLHGISIQTPAGVTYNSLDEAVAGINQAIHTATNASGGDAQRLAQANLQAALRIDNNGQIGIVITSHASPDLSSQANFERPMFSVSGAEIDAANFPALDGQYLFADRNLLNPFNPEDVPALAYTLDPFAATPLANYGGDYGGERPGVDVLTRETASRAIGLVDGALYQISTMRAKLGAVQNRLEARIETLGVGSVNMSASRSRIMDADFAAETAQLTKYQILQQSGITVLTQANALPQSALSLLQS
jgi:flagellin